MKIESTKRVTNSKTQPIVTRVCGYVDIVYELLEVIMMSYDLKFINENINYCNKKKKESTHTAKLFLNRFK